MKFEQWNGFTDGSWTDSIDVRGFIQKNYTPYTGDDSFLADATEKTKKLWDIVLDLYKKEKDNGGVLDIDAKTISGIAAYKPGYIQKDLEEIVGLQTDAPLKRAIMPYGGIRIVEKSCAAYNKEVDPEVEKIFHGIRKTHNDGVFDAYTQDIRAARSSHLLTGLPDGYGRGRIIGDYRRVALYGVDFLIEKKKENLKYYTPDNFDEGIIRDREELSEQIKALEELKQMAADYGFDISLPAKNAKEAIQWTYFAYLAAIKEQNGAAMSIGRTSTFLDIYIERDLQNGTLTEEQAQELMDHFVMKLRLVRFLRTPEYDELFSGDPVWVTESIGGMGIDGRTMVTKNSFRILHTLTTLGPAPEPNLTVLWSTRLPEGFKKFVTALSINSENDVYAVATLANKIYKIHKKALFKIIETPFATPVGFGDFTGCEAYNVFSTNVSGGGSSGGGSITTPDEAAVRRMAAIKATFTVANIKEDNANNTTTFYITSKVMDLASFDHIKLNGVVGNYNVKSDLAMFTLSNTPTIRILNMTGYFDADEKLPIPFVPQNYDSIFKIITGVLTDDGTGTYTFTPTVIPYKVVNVDDEVNTMALEPTVDGNLAILIPERVAPQIETGLVVGGMQIYEDWVPDSSILPDIQAALTDYPNYRVYMNQYESYAGNTVILNRYKL